MKVVTISGVMTVNAIISYEIITKQPYRMQNGSLVIYNLNTLPLSNASKLSRNSEQERTSLLAEDKRQIQSK